MIFVSRLLKYNKETIRDKFKYKFYKLRDDLAILAMKEKISEDSEEYEVLMVSINTLINSTEDYSLSTEDYSLYHLGRQIIYFNTNENYHKQMVRIENKLDTYGIEMSQLLYEYHKLLAQVINKNSKSDRFLLKIAMSLYAISKKLEKTPEYKETIKTKIKEPIIAMEEIERREEAVNEHLVKHEAACVG